ncbi:MAG: radical SAM protein [Deltaproteobacteria bacterium]|nr:radical SAM protein [Deltaproteobacteria bacterium]
MVAAELTRPESLRPDILRVENFGAVYYHRRSAEFSVLPPPYARLLLGALRRHVMAAYKRAPEIATAALVAQVAHWRRQGVLDAAYRSTARVVRRPAADSLSAPLVTNLQITRACNLRCQHCFVDIDTRPHPAELSMTQVRSLFGELSGAGAPVVILAGGEPLARDDFYDVVDAIADYDLDVALCTNATLIRERDAARLARSAIRWFSISLDGADAATHDALRGAGAFVRALRGIGLLLAAGGQNVKLRVTVTRQNAHTLAAFAPLARKLGVGEVVFKPFRHSTMGEALHGEHLYISRAAYSDAIDVARRAWPNDAPRASFDDGMPEGLPAWTRITPEFACVGGTTHASVIYDGRVVACDAVFDPADWTLHEHGFVEAWLNAPTVRRWRGLEAGDECRGCGNFKRCGGGCRARALAAGHSMHDPDPWAYCEPKRSVPRLNIIH